MRYPQIIILAGFILFSAGCKKNPLKVNISSVKEEVTCIRYGDELFGLGEAPDSIQLEMFHAKYPAFSDLYGYQVIRTGNMLNPGGREMLNAFLSDPTTKEIKEMSEKLYGDFSEHQKQLVTAFKHYRYYFPDKPIPVIYTCISGFNQSVFTAEGIIGIGLDKYLGAECHFYPELGIPRYKQRKMTPLMIPSDVMRAWGMTEFDISPAATTLVDHIVHEGKLLYFTEAMLPETADTLLTGYTKDQLDWCKMNEAQMWNFLVERKLLFSTQQMDIVRYINDAPSTNGFPGESPGRIGVWLGRQIIRAYVKKNPDITLMQLMADLNYQQILNNSGYAP